MTIFAQVVLLAWAPLVVLVGSAVPIKRLVAMALVAGWLLLPNGGLEFRGLPDYDKTMVTVIALLTAIAVYQPGLLFAIRFKPIDLIPMLICVSATAASVANSLGIHDALATGLDAAIAYLAPYLIGRACFGDRAGLHLLATSIVIGGLLYVPLCLLEVRLSPQLHTLFYGFNERWNPGGLRFGGWRPMVFLDGGLQLGMWMTIASLIGVWMWSTKAWRTVFGIRLGLPLAVLLMTTVLCRSLGSLVLLFFGLAAMFAAKSMRTRAPLILMMLIPPTYIGVRSLGFWDGMNAVETVRRFSEERAESLEFRLTNENLLIEKASARPIFGWGGWGRSRVDDDYGRDITVTDGMWIIEYGSHGLFGLISKYSIMLLPLILLTFHYPHKAIHTDNLAPAFSLAVCIVLFSIDSLLNDMPNPILIVASGALAGAIATEQLSPIGTHPTSHLAYTGNNPNAAIVPRKLSSRSPQ